APGYALRLEPEQLDLAQFERLAEDAGTEFRRGEKETAVELLREALRLWRGEPLADLAGEPFATVAVRRLDEIRLVALERRVEAELALGRHSELIPELEALVVSEPLRERFRAQLMLALYRSDRQTEALDAYRAARETLVDELGLEPAPALRELEHAILAQDPSLELSIPAQEARPLLAVPTGDLTLLTIASAIATGGSSELIVARLVSDESEVGPAAVELAHATTAGTRVAAFTTDDPAADTVRLATAYDVELVLLDAPPGLDSSHVPDRLAAIFYRSPSGVALLTAHVCARGAAI